MADKRNRTISKTKIRQTIDLKEIFGEEYDFTGKKAFKEKFGQLLIDAIIDRTGKTLDINGRNLKSPYSDSYSNSKDFEKYGKSKNKVNMELKGNMLDNIDIKDIKANSFDIAITDTTEKKKAYNHVVGDTLPKRDFFGVNKKEINAAKKSMMGDLKGLKKRDISPAEIALRALETKEGATAIDKLIDSIFEVDIGQG